MAPPNRRAFAQPALLSAPHLHLLLLLCTCWCSKPAASSASSGVAGSVFSAGGEAPASAAAGGAGGAGSAGGTGRKRYADRVWIVVMQDLPPVADFLDNPISSSSRLASASSSARSSSISGGSSSGRAELRSAEAREYAATLTRSHTATLAAAGVSSTARLASMKYALNAFGAVLTPEQAARVRVQAGVASVRRSPILYPRVLGSAQFLGLPTTLWPASGGRNNAGEDVIIGVVDSGIWPEHPAFSDQGVKAYGAAPAKWKGACMTGPDFPATSCNRKLIGARYFMDGYQAEWPGAIDTSVEYRSPRDANGHGTWCAGAAASSPLNISFLGTTQKVSSGMAPRARIAAYKVCWNDGAVRGGGGGCLGLDLLLALDKALADGVDIISMSLGSLGGSDLFAEDELALLRLSVNGVVVVNSAGNSGEDEPFANGPQTEHNSPWYLTVAASTINFTYTVDVKLGDTRVLTGLGTVAGNANTANRRLVLSSSCAHNPLNRQAVVNASLCYEGSLSRIKCAGAVVACIRGETNRVSKSKVVAAAGGVGFILLSNDDRNPSAFPDTYAVPGCLLDARDSAVVRRYIEGTARPTVTIEPMPPAPAMASFSSRGPVVDPTAPTVPRGGPSYHTLKPEVTAPGYLLLGVTPARNLSVAKDERFKIESGTSMSTPHVAGVAALLKQRWPAWSAARIKSVIMTTASAQDNSGKPIKMADTWQPATPFSYGAGHINPRAMLNPGLVYDAGQADYYNFLAGVSAARAAYLPGVTFFSQPRPLSGYNLNQPYICVGRLQGNVTVKRRVTNVVGAAVVFKAFVVRPLGVDVVIVPQQLSLAADASATFAVTLVVRRPSSSFRFGSLTWVSGALAVRSVIAVHPLAVR